MRTTGWIAVAVVIIIAGSAWYYYAHIPASAGTPPVTNSQGLPGTSTGPAGDGTGVSQNLILGQTSSTTLGAYLTAYNGMTVYTYAPDQQTPGKSACINTCRAIWPPYLVGTKADIHVPATLTGKVGTITRDDGSLQVTYNDKPLYFYTQDVNPGDANGQGVGGVWYVVAP